jgi:hypothetical protein
MLYKAIDVWRRDGDRAKRYRCFEVISTGRFCVQSADFYPISNDTPQREFHERQFVELFLSQPPDERSTTFDSLADAIAHHDREFGNG